MVSFARHKTRSLSAICAVQVTTMITAATITITITITIIMPIKERSSVFLRKLCPSVYS
jgi:hypothetical protein